MATPAVFSSYRTANFLQYYQLTVNENSNSDYFTSVFGMFCIIFPSNYQKICVFIFYKLLQIFSVFLFLKL